MKIYLINGENNIGKTDFAVNLAESLAVNGRVLLTSFFRDPKSNIEDYFKKDGMITYDISDYFLGLIDLDKAIVNENNNLDFIISPLVENKYELRIEDVYKLIDAVDYDVLIIDNLNFNINQAIRVDIISADDVAKDLHSDYFFVNKVNDSFDPRNYRTELLAKESKYLGFVKENEYFKDIIDRLINEKAEDIEELGFFEKIKKMFKK